MATVTKPIALDRSLNTTESPSRNIADVLAEELSAMITAIGGLNFINFVVVAELPTTGISTTTIYLVPSDDPQSENTYDEYINLNGTVSGWEKIGSTDIDLSGYYTSAEVDALLADKADVSDIPTVNDGTLTIQQNGDTKGTFTANQSGNSTVNIEIPTTDIQTAVDEFETYNGGILDSLKVSLSLNQDLHGYDSPWVGGAGKNSFVSATAKTEEQNNVKIWTDGDGIYHINGTPTATTNILFPLKQGFTIPPSSTHHFYLGNDFNNVNVTLSLMNGSTQVDNWTCTPVNRDYDSYSAMANKYIDGVRVIVQSGVSLSNVSIAPMLLLDTETDTSYASWDNICPISGHTQVDVDVSDGLTTQDQVTVNLGGTYYSGIFDVVSGVFTPDTAEVDLGSLTWTYQSNYPRFRADAPSDIEFPSSQTEIANAICECYRTVTMVITQSRDSSIGIGPAAYPYIYAHDTRYTDANTYKTAMSGVMLVYKLANPTPIQLSPTMVKALVGENHLSAPLEGQEITESKYKQMFTFDDVIAYIQSLS